MIKPMEQKLSVAILNNIDLDKIIYAEITQPGGMGNAGGIILYAHQGGTEQLICYETNICDDQETYLVGEELLYKEINSLDGSEYFDLYTGGMGNQIVVNKKANLEITDDYFVYTTGEVQFQIVSSVHIIFTRVAYDMKKDKGH